ncbi:MAG: cytosine permease [Gammaproteobacteria bacterium]|nr:cytosine permease [Gammaproteobacteria bacterium]
MPEIGASTRIEDLRPVPAAERVFTLLSYILMLWASLIVVQGFVLGQALLPPQGTLTLLQGVAVVLLAALTMAVFMSLNGQAGLQHGVPYCIQVRAAFGIRGARFAEVLRLIPALIWYGFGTWIAALSTDGIVRTLTGFSPPGITFVYFLLLQAAQTWLAYRGIRVMKWFNVGASVALVLIMGYMLFRTLGARGLQVAESWRSAGDWGWGFWSGVNATIGILVAVMASASDLTRYVEQRQRTLWWGHVLGFLPPLFFMMFFGFVAAVTTGVWDPIEALMQLSPGPLLMVLMLAFILVAQFSTNLAVNILPPAFIFQEMFGITWRGGVIIAGILGTLTFPWLLLESGEGFVAFINYYTAFFGPLLGCMLAEYWLDRSTLDVDGLYRAGAGGPYWYDGGINWAGVVSTIWVAIVTMICALEISWLVGMPLGFLSYLALKRILHGSSRAREAAME